jgi:hypothetical protein
LLLGWGSFSGWRVGRGSFSEQEKKTGQKYLEICKILAEEFPLK